VITCRRVGSGYRNRTRRRLRESAGQSSHRKAGLAVHYFAKSTAAKATFAELREEWFASRRRLFYFAPLRMKTFLHLADPLLR